MVGRWVVEVRDIHEATVAAARAHLDGATFADAWAEGEALSRDEAIAEALAWSWPQEEVRVGEARALQARSTPGADVDAGPA